MGYLRQRVFKNKTGQASNGYQLQLIFEIKYY